MNKYLISKKNFYVKEKTIIKKFMKKLIITFYIYYL